jgi:hypothetical protein
VTPVSEGQRQGCQGRRDLAPVAPVTHVDAWLHLGASVDLEAVELVPGDEPGALVEEDHREGRLLLRP